MIGLVLSAVLLAAGAVAGQSVSLEPRKPAQLTAIYEDIEVFRRLLIKQLQSHSTSLGIPAAQGPIEFGSGVNPYAPSVYPYATGGFSGTSTSGAANTLGFQGTNFLQPATSQGTGFSGGYRNVTGGAQYIRPFNVEGTYIKGHGVVFCVTLPPSRRDPLESSAKVDAKPLSEWDRTRLEVRGEKAPTASTPAPKSPGLAEVVLRVMFENGKHFRHLADNESFTVAITFRSAGATGQPLAIYSAQSGRGSGATTSGTALYGNKSGAASARDYELLGDLHFKKGKVQEAVQSYLDAFKMAPSKDLLGKVVKAYIALDKSADANKAVEFIRKLEAYLSDKDGPKVASAKNTGVSEAATGSKLPAKLIISAPWRLLAAAGTGQAAFESFRKMATVEYLTFAAK
jgi:hypothetical protein